MNTPLPRCDAALVQAATDVWARAYAPYSKFRVGAAMRFADGRVVVGCNVENASFGLTQCAERSAICTAIAAGMFARAKDRAWTQLIVVADADTIIVPCGACRQVICEFAAPTMPVYLHNLRDASERLTDPAALLPYAFKL